MRALFFPCQPTEAHRVNSKFASMELKSIEHVTQGLRK